MRALVQKLLYVIANGMGGFMDLTMGAGIAYILGWLVLGEMVPWWWLLVAAPLGALPDLDLIGKLIKHIRGIPIGNHHETLAHWPMITVPSCAVIALLIADGYWALVVVVCLLWHYFHDSRWYADRFSRGMSDIDWTRPITNRLLPYMGHTEWLEKFWLQPSTLSFFEIGVGTAILALLVCQYVGMWLAAGTIFATLWAGVFDVWLIYNLGKKRPA